MGTKAPLKAIGTFLLMVASTGSNAQTVDFDYLLLARSARHRNIHNQSTAVELEVINVGINIGIGSVARDKASIQQFG
ncbi:hypothetical protein [Halorientalis marina]|uniref:hypothetical protein n=1 Tax=Halorientalis marina TaxID=2931976 RepID=UPI001FF3E991|nr:hypothetical protein [Halorientalis marina]